MGNNKSKNDDKKPLREEATAGKQSADSAATKQCSSTGEKSNDFVIEREQLIRKQLFDVPGKDKIIEQVESDNSLYHVKTDATGSCMFHAVALWLTYQGRGLRTKESVRTLKVSIGVSQGNEFVA